MEHVSLKLGDTQVLDDVSISVENGSFVSVLGQSGAGKSTTLKVISGLVPQDSGRVLFDDTCVDDVPVHRRDVAMVFQDIRLFPNMSIIENVAFPLKMRGVKKRERMDEAEQMLKRVHLEGYGSRRTHELSGGQQQRVALARALCAHPKALLLDEPFSGLDEQLRGDMRSLVTELHDSFGITTLMVTHDPDEALTMSDNIILMEEGKVVGNYTSAELSSNALRLSGGELFSDPSAIEGVVANGVFTCGKLSISAPDADEGPAVLVRIPGKEPFVHNLTA